MKKLQYISALFLLVLAWTACTENELFLGEEQVTLRYTVSLPQDAQTRAIGDGSAVEELIVGVFEEGAETGVNFSFEKNEEGKFTPEIKLLKNKTYSLVFWAQKKNNGVYNTNNLSNITINYDNFNKTLTEAAALDAFCKTITDVTVNTAGGVITLTRPFAMLSVGATGGNVSDIASATLKINKVYTTYQPLTGTVTGEKENVTLTYSTTDEGTFDIEGNSYQYLATAFLLVPNAKYKPSITAEFKDGDGKVESTVEVENVTVETNHRTNIGKPLNEPWDGKTYETITPANGVIKIETAVQLATLVRDGYNATTPVTIELCSNLDMDNKPIARSNDYTLQDVTFVGNGKTISNLGTSLFGKATNLSVSNLTIEKVTATASSNVTHIGAVVNELKGNGSFTNVTVKGATVTTTNGAAGGMVGYISRVTEDNRNEKLEVTFSGCTVDSTTVSGSKSEGKFVGLLSGYDYQETLNINSCTHSDVTLSNFSNSTVGYNLLLGDEKYCRGTIKIDGTRQLPYLKWDGSRKIEPLKAVSDLDEGVTTGVVIYSAPDLAYLGGNSWDTVTLLKDIDLNGQGPDGNMDTADDYNFTPIEYINNLNGNNKTISNLRIYIEKSGWRGGAFILQTQNATTHKDLTFKNSNIEVHHDPNDNSGNAYAATLCTYCSSGATYNVSNIKVENGTVYGVNKMGGILGYVIYTKLSMKDCVVKKSYI